MKSGFVSIVGRPNTGKSTLLNALINQKIAITSNKSGTTRNAIYGIYNDETTQIVFIDTPGIQKPLQRLGTLLNQKAYNSIENVDLICFVVDASEKFGKGDYFVLNRIKEENKPTFLVINKIDKISKDKLLVLIKELNEIYSFQEIIPLSSLKQDNTKELITTIKKYLTGDIKYFPDNAISNISLNFQVSEIVREKILNLTSKEVPHAVTCFVEELEEEEKKVTISVIIIVDRDSLKKIIIGKNGQMLKNIGMQARLELEDLFDKKVYLQTTVKAINNWRDSDKYLMELGLKDIDE